ncbi:MAG: putative rane protein [Bacteroidota bacterium]|jgi:hypothetical protein
MEVLVTRNKELSVIANKLRKNHFLTLHSTRAMEEVESFLMAHFLPALTEEGFNAKAGFLWKIVELELDTKNPTVALAQALSNYEVLYHGRIKTNFEEQLYKTLQEQTNGLIQAYRQSEYIQRYNLLLLIRNWERIAFAKDWGEVLHFVASLMKAINNASVAIYIVAPASKATLDTLATLPAQFHESRSREISDAQYSAINARDPYKKEVARKYLEKTNAEKQLLQDFVYLIYNNIYEIHALNEVEIAQTLRKTATNRNIHIDEKIFDKLIEELYFTEKEQLEHVKNCLFKMRSGLSPLPLKIDKKEPIRLGGLDPIKSEKKEETISRPIATPSVAPNVPLAPSNPSTVAIASSGGLAKKGDNVLNALKTNYQRGICERLFKTITVYNFLQKCYESPKTRLDAIRDGDNAPIPAQEVMKVAMPFIDAGILSSSVGTLNTDSLVWLANTDLVEDWKMLQSWAKVEDKDGESYVELSRRATEYFQTKAKEKLLQGKALEDTINWYQRVKPSKDWAGRYDLNFERAMEYFKASITHKEEMAKAQKALVTPSSLGGVSTTPITKPEEPTIASVPVSSTPTPVVGRKEEEIPDDTNTSTYKLLSQLTFKYYQAVSPDRLIPAKNLPSILNWLDTFKPTAEWAAQFDANYERVMKFIIESKNYVEKPPAPVVQAPPPPPVVQAPPPPPVVQAPPPPVIVEETTIARPKIVIKPRSI